jgi:hypothetical protein
MDYHDRARLRLGLFMPNCNHVYSLSSYKPGPDDWTFASNKAIAVASEQAGLTFFFRWASGADGVALLTLIRSRSRPPPGPALYWR